MIFCDFFYTSLYFFYILSIERKIIFFIVGVSPPKTDIITAAFRGAFNAASRAVNTGDAVKDATSKEGKLCIL